MLSIRKHEYAACADAHRSEDDEEARVGKVHESGEIFLSGGIIPFCSCS